jgi:3-methyladenine DNA glycosylase AlkD
VHVEQAERYAKFWLEPIALAESRGFRGPELRDLHSLIAQNREKFILAWDEHFSQ